MDSADVSVHPSRRGWWSRRGPKGASRLVRRTKEACLERSAIGDERNDTVLVTLQGPWSAVQCASVEPPQAEDTERTHAP